MMKSLILILTALSILAFGQQKKNLDGATKDAIAVNNVNSILISSKKSYPNLKSDLSHSSEMNKNVNQLLISAVNFNTVINGQYLDHVSVGTFTRPRVDALDKAGRTVLSVPVYKSK